MIEVCNFDGDTVSVMVSRIITVTSGRSGQSCGIKLDNGDVIFCTEGHRTITARVNKYLDDYK